MSKKPSDGTVTPFQVGMQIGETIGMQSASVDDPPAVLAAKMVAGFREIAEKGDVVLGAGFVRDLASRNIQLGIELLREAERMDGLKISCLLCGGLASAESNADQTVTQPMVILHETCLTVALKTVGAS